MGLRMMATILCIVLVQIAAFSQSTINLAGTVKNSSGKVVQGATVTVRGSNLSAVTDANGMFQIGGVLHSKEIAGVSGTIQPFISSNTLSMMLPEHEQYVSVTTYNSRGQFIAQPFMGKAFQGALDVNLFDAKKQFACGRYFVHVENNNNSSIIPVMYNGRNVISANVRTQSTPLKKKSVTAEVAAGAVVVLDVTKDGYAPERKDLSTYSGSVDTIFLQNSIIVPEPQKILSMGMPEKISRNFTLETNASANILAQFERIAKEFSLNVVTGTGAGNTILRISYGSETEALKDSLHKGEQGYRLSVANIAGNTTIDIVGGDEAGAFYGLQTLRSLIYSENQNLFIRPMVIEDWPAFKRRGIIFGYANDDLLKARADLMTKYKLNMLVHPGLRDEWNTVMQSNTANLKNYCSSQYTEFTALMGYFNRLAEMGDTVVQYFARRFDAGIRSFTIDFDDQELNSMELGVSRAASHAKVVRKVYSNLKSRDSSVKFIFCPVPYGGKPSTGFAYAASSEIGVKYFNIVADSTPSDVPIFWTGDEHVFSPRITTTGAQELVTATRGRKPFIWDNDAITFANKGAPISGRDRGLYKVTSGYAANMNEMETAWNSDKKAELTLLSIAMYCWNPEKYDTASARKAAEKILGGNNVITASSSYEGDGWGISTVMDGILTSNSSSMGWSSANSTGSNHTEWIRIDRNVSGPLNRVDLYPRTDSPNVGEGFPVDFKIEVSTDLQNWTSVITKTNFTKPTEVQSFRFNSINAAGVRITGTKLRQGESGYYMQFSEIALLKE